MAKVKTSVKPGRSSKKLKSKDFDLNSFAPIVLKKNAKLESHDPSVFLKNPKAIKEALTEAFLEGDVDAVKEILAAHIRALNKDHLSKITGVSRATIFRMLDHNSNPSFENVLKVVSSLKLAG